LATDITSLNLNTGTPGTKGASYENLDGDTSYGSPSGRGSITLDYKVAAVDVTARVRYVSGGAFTLLSTYNTTVPAAEYVDLGVQYTIPHNDNYVVYADIDNVADALNARNYSATYYDIIGRRFDVGLRVRF
jgi:hypothetical protein